MRLLDLFAIVIVGLLVGNELAVSAFMNPPIWKHNDRTQATALAQSLGSVMPGLYALCFVLLLTEAWLHRHATAGGFAIVAASLWLAILIYTVTLLVPLNNRLAKTPASDTAFDWLSTHRQWDQRHRIRIALLTLAFVLLTWSALAR